MMRTLAVIENKYQQKRISHNLLDISVHQYYSWLSNKTILVIKISEGSYKKLNVIKTLDFCQVDFLYFGEDSIDYSI